ncbi:hypothetical protein [Bacillus sp. AFS053548]|nr:hypothetical protein [Bacillus sp. AFS053548]
MAKGHTNKGQQKSSVDQFGHSEESAYSKSKKMEEFHKKNTEKDS